MGMVRIIKRKDGVIQTQHRGDERYDDSTLPPGTKPEDVAEELLVDTHDLDEALDLLGRRCPGVPTSVVETLTEWARGAARIALTRGVILADDDPPPAGRSPERCP